MNNQNPKSKLPSKGILAGIKNDLAKAKEGGKAYDPRGFGTAWSHGFLNQKPWHPLNFRNQVKKYDAEQRQITLEKERERAQAEFDAEQEYFRTLSYLSSDKQELVRAAQSVAFMYTKPPGLEAALARDTEGKKTKLAASSAAEEGRKPTVAAGVVPGLQSADPGTGLSSRQLLDRIRSDPCTTMLHASADIRFLGALKARQFSPAHGGISKDAENQQLLIDFPEKEEAQGLGPPAGIGLDQDVSPTSTHRRGHRLGISHEKKNLSDQERVLDVALGSLPPEVSAEFRQLSGGERRQVLKKMAKMQAREDAERKLCEAEEVLRSAGYDVEAIRASCNAPARSRSRKHIRDKAHKSQESKSKSRKRSRKDREGDNEIR